MSTTINFDTDVLMYRYNFVILTINLHKNVVIGKLLKKNIDPFQSLKS